MQQFQDRIRNFILHEPENELLSIKYFTVYLLNVHFFLTLEEYWPNSALFTQSPVLNWAACLREDSRCWP